MRVGCLCRCVEVLLGRRPADIDADAVASYVTGRRVLVTGAGGSIGSELCRQLARYGPARLVLFELSEFNLYAIEQELAGSHPALPNEVSPAMPVVEIMPAGTARPWATT